MLVSQLFDCADFSREIKDKEIKNITDNSLYCSEGSVFICRNSGEKYVKEALDKGAVLVVAEKKLCENCYVTDDVAGEYARLSAEFFGNSHKRLRLIAVTGTNGKTTTANMLYTILTLSGKKCGLIGTVKSNICGEENESALSTPDPYEMHGMFSRLCQWGAEYCIIEASSQGISEGRLAGLEFYLTVLTNISQDHLDYHGTMENYIESKKSIFALSEKSIINADDEKSQEFIGNSKGKVITYSLSKNEADYIAKSIKLREDGSDYAVIADYAIHRIKLNVPGEFNIMNSLAAVAAGVECDVSLEFCAYALKNFSGVKGRMEIVDTSAEYKVIIDYAHTPDAMKKVLLCLNSFPHNRIITVFGCGGERDKDKRAQMGDVALQLSDIVIVTSDNPRGEDPTVIIDDILSGMKKSKKSIYIHENRRKAIEYALKIAEKNDIILLAGKGHETYQLIGEDKIPMDERQIVREFLSK
ncbi:MAG: UDP-N-acetylmuramoyl-L-alanyl-D-glutamate--2,6-diaminopimelate ligase [Clostridia bacterium]|nr:UDP-N-acetylmuramoyl-L-alanyl-D-glutamate--2,6-diaminopimelate ligase [Clostridia bacterium]